MLVVVADCVLYWCVCVAIVFAMLCVYWFSYGCYWFVLVSMCVYWLCKGLYWFVVFMCDVMCGVLVCSFIGVYALLFAFVGCVCVIIDVCCFYVCLLAVGVVIRD